MSIKFFEVVCDEHGIGGNREYCGDNDAQLDLINVLYFFYLEARCNCDPKSPLGKIFSSDNL
jgi:hypothetical protein